MPPLHKLTTKAREALRRAHELAIERGQNHVNPVHLLCAQILDNSVKVASTLKDEFISTEHLFLSIFDIPCVARDILGRFKIEKDAVTKIIEELKTNPPSKDSEP